MKSICGVVLAGGLGTRLLPLTSVTNKHLLPVYRKPMIFYPVEKLVRAGIDRIMVVTGGEYAGQIMKVLGNGRRFGLSSLEYAYQEGEGGIAEALGLARSFVGQDRVCVILGDNIFEESIKGSVREFREGPGGAKLFLKHVPDPERFGCPAIRGGRVVRIDEKPETPESSYAVTGVYLFDDEVFPIIDNLVRSRRGELEISDVNNAYIVRGALEYEVLTGWWTDAGTFESLFHASSLVKSTRHLAEPVGKATA